ncbi:MAG: GntR family transcriptional regulator [Pseudomonadota bacterium]
MNSESFVPLHYQLFKEIKAQILSGDYAQGDFLGTEKLLMDKYGVSCTTLRRALQHLVQSGYVYRKAGKGTFVRRVNVDNNSSPLYSFIEEMELLGMKPKTEVLAINTMKANDLIAKKLEVSKSSIVYTIKKLLKADSKPIAVWESFWQYDIGRRLAEHDLSLNLFDTVENKLRITLGEADADFEAALATAEEATLIGVAENSPLLIMLRTNYSVDGQPILFGRTAYRGDMYRFHIRMVRSGGMWSAGIRETEN